MPSIKNEIEKIIHDRHISPHDFHGVSEEESQIILEKIETVFSSKKSPSIDELWNRLSEEPLTLTDKNFFQKYHTVIDQDIFVLLALEDGEKYSLFEGKIKYIETILSEIPFCEYYILSKNYDWLICENHHDQIYVVGTVRKLFN